MMSFTQTPVSQRIPVVDFLRGLVLFGVVVSNYMNFRQAGTIPTGIDKYLAATENILFGPVWISLSFLFGFGFWSLIERLKSEQRKIIPVFLKRMFWLFLIGIFNAVFYYGDILRDFAVMGIFLLFFLKAEKKNLLIFTMILTLLIPAVAAFTLYSGFYHRHDWLDLQPLFESRNWKDIVRYNLLRLKFHQVLNPYYLVSVHFEMLVFFLWGILSYRFNIFHFSNLTLKFAKRTLAISISGILLIGIVQEFPETKIIHQYYQLYVLREMLCAMFILSAGALVYLSGLFSGLLKKTELYGKMTLTNYIFQNIISAIIFSGAGFAIGLKQPLWVYSLIAVLVYVFQLFISAAWLNKFRIGPFEWIWRSLSSGKFLSIHKK